MTMIDEIYECDQEIQPMFLADGAEPTDCGWKSGAEDYDEPRKAYGAYYCPRCGFILPKPKVTA